MKKGCCHCQRNKKKKQKLYLDSRMAEKGNIVWGILQYTLMAELQNIDVLSHISFSWTPLPSVRVPSVSSSTYHTSGGPSIRCCRDRENSLNTQSTDICYRGSIDAILNLPNHVNARLENDWQAPFNKRLIAERNRIHFLLISVQQRSTFVEQEVQHLLHNKC